MKLNEMIRTIKTPAQVIIECDVGSIKINLNVMEGDAASPVFSDAEIAGVDITHTEDGSAYLIRLQRGVK